MIRDDAIEFILREDIEGGYSNNPADPGGETNFGISKKSYPHLDIRNLKRADAAAIYREDYWNPTSGRVVDVAPRLAFVMLDCAVNQGKGFAVMALQEIVHAKQDGIIGPNTYAALQDVIDARGEEWVVAKFMSRRSMRYAANPNVQKFGPHWFYRMAQALMAACEAVAGKPLDEAAPPRSDVLPGLLDQIASLVEEARKEAA